MERKFGKLVKRMLFFIVAIQIIILNSSAYLITYAMFDEQNILWEDVATLGTAGNFDLFTFGDVTNLTHVEGAVAIAGNYTSNGNGLSMATHIKNDVQNNDITFLIGKQLTAYNTVMSCNAGKIGHKAEYKPIILDYLYDKCVTVDSESVNKFFNNAHEYLCNNNKSISELPKTHDYYINESNEITFDCKYADLAVFELDYDKCNLPEYGFGKVNFVNVGKMAVVNLKSSKTVHIGDFITDEWKSNNILFNVTADCIDLSNARTYASILAPNTTVVASNGQMSGNLICDNLYSTGSYEIHHNTYKSIIPTLTTTTTTNPTTSSTNATSSTTTSTTHTSNTTNTTSTTTSSTTSNTTNTTNSTTSTTPTSRTSSTTSTTITTNSTTSSTTNSTTDSTTSSTTNSTTSTTQSTGTTSTTSTTKSTTNSTTTSNTTSSTSSTTSHTTNSTTSSTTEKPTSSTTSSTTEKPSSTTSSTTSNTTKPTTSSTTTTSKPTTSTTTTTTRTFVSPDSNSTATTTITYVQSGTTKPIHIVLGSNDGKDDTNVEIVLGANDIGIPDTSDKGFVNIAIVVFIISSAVLCCCHKKPKY